MKDALRSAGAADVPSHRRNRSREPDRLMTITTMKKIPEPAFAATRRPLMLHRWLAASLLLAILLALPFGHACAQSQALQNSPAAEAAGDEALHFWAVNEGGARIYRPDAAACSRIRGLSAQFADAISNKYKVPAYTLKIVAVRLPEASAGCELLVEMPDGPKVCQLGSVIKTFGGGYMAHTYARGDDGSVRYVAGDCRPAQ